MYRMPHLPPKAFPVLSVAALALLAAAPAAGGVVEDLPAVPVHIVSYSFQPPVVVVPLGVPVAWDCQGMSIGNCGHTVTTVALGGGAPNDPTNSDGDSDTFHILLYQQPRFVHTFTKPGVYPYVCVPHASIMKGVVVVAGAPPA